MATSKLLYRYESSPLLSPRANINPPFAISVATPPGLSRNNLNPYAPLPPPRTETQAARPAGDASQENDAAALETAAVRIQAVQRGKVSRKEMGQQKEAVESSSEARKTRSEADQAFLLANYPKRLEDVTIEWLSTLLHSKVSKGEVKVKLEAGVTGDAGMLCAVHQFCFISRTVVVHACMAHGVTAIFGLDYDKGSSGPASIVLKYAKSLPASRALAQDANMYEKETFFYMNLHSLVAPVLPIPYVVDVFIDPEKPKEFFCIAMENLSVDYEAMDQIKVDDDLYLQLDSGHELAMAAVLAAAGTDVPPLPINPIKLYRAAD